MAQHEQETQTISEHMDYAQHEWTWRLFTNLVKWGIIVTAVIMVVLYFAINP